MTFLQPKRAQKEKPKYGRAVTFDSSLPRTQSLVTRSQAQTDTKEEVSGLSTKNAFPNTFQFDGYLDVRPRHSKPWKRRYFVLNNNFLLCASTSHAKKLERVIPLEGSNIRKSTQTSDMTFEIFTRNHKLFFRAASPTQCDAWTRAIQKASRLKIKDIYRFLYTLGTSGLTKVVAARHRTQGTKCAIKIVDKRLCNKHMMKTEIAILRKLNNQYVVQLFDLIETKKFLYIVMEKCEGGELFDQIAELDGEHYTEENCCDIMHQIAKGVDYMHSIGVVHRDLKPENILCVYPHSISKVKIADFGISKMLKESLNEQMSTAVGSITYCAPEVLHKRKTYDYTVDYWSIGVIMYILLCGYAPFDGESDIEISQNIIKSDVVLDENDWGHVSEEAKNIVMGLLDKNPSTRFNCSDILKLTWKVSSKSASFRQSQIKFKRHVIQRKMGRLSMSAMEKDSKVSRRINRNAAKQHGLKKRVSSDDMMEGSESALAIKRDHRYQRNVEAFRGPRMSKGTEELLELHLPMHKRESLFTRTIPVIIEEEETSNI